MSAAPAAAVGRAALDDRLARALANALIAAVRAEDSHQQPQNIITSSTTTATNTRSAA